MTAPPSEALPSSAPGTVAAEPTAVTEPGLARRALTSLRRDPVALIAVLAVIVLALVAVFAPLLAPYDPLKAYSDGLAANGAPVAPGHEFLLGTDPNGRDVLSRMIFGARVSLLVGVVATGLASVIGVLVGGIAGYAGGLVDSILMRITDVVLSFPILLFCVALIAITGPSTRNVMLVIAFGYWTYLARIVRSLVLSLKEREFVTAAKTLGIGHAAILRRHILPHLVPAIIVYSTLGVASSILIEASLSYLGIGVPLPQASWGQMISQGQEYFQAAPWLLIAPGIALIVTVLAFNLAGDWLTDLLDPATSEGGR
ncbi:ABC transporter permease [Trebonia kvetii]|uniref:ABC transporter permease n=1 Tax=Trebonia kvetii TaxID=2480626 RepID=UPI001C9E7DED|nr:ABC transporter permease [Trebonia kvetii]